MLRYLSKALGLAHIVLCVLSLFSFANHLVQPLPSPPASPIDTITLTSNITLHFTTEDAFNLFATGILLIIFLMNIFIYHCHTIRFVRFSTNLSTKQKSNMVPNIPFVHFFMLHLNLTLIKENYYFLLLLIMENKINLKLDSKIHPKLTRNLCRYVFLILTAHIMYLSSNPSAHTLALLTFQNGCYHFTKKSPCWLPFLLLILSHDIHQNPGPPTNSYLTFMSWNLNSLAKDNFHRLKLLEAQNSLFNYDLISLSETSLNDCCFTYKP